MNTPTFRRRMLAYILLLGIAAFIVALPLAVAFAMPVVALAAVAPDTTISAGPVFQILMPYILSALGALVTALIAWAAAALQRWTGVRIDAAHREALHSAAMTGINLALSKLGVAASGLTIDTRSVVIAEAIAWMEKSVPGALKHFGMTPDRLGEFVEGKLGGVRMATPAAVVVAAPGKA